MGIEPTSTAWEAVILPMNYIRTFTVIYFTKKEEKSQEASSRSFPQARSAPASGQTWRISKGESEYPVSGV